MGFYSDFDFGFEVKTSKSVLFSDVKEVLCSLKCTLLLKLTYFTQLEEKIKI
jgi:hypothetical protein